MSKFLAIIMTMMTFAMQGYCAEEVDDTETVETPPVQLEYSPRFDSFSQKFGGACLLAHAILKQVRSMNILEAGTVEDGAAVAVDFTATVGLASMIMWGGMNRALKLRDDVIRNMENPALSYRQKLSPVLECAAIGTAFLAIGFGFSGLTMMCCDVSACSAKAVGVGLLVLLCTQMFYLVTSDHFYPSRKES